MSLVVVIQNISELAEISDYEAEVSVNGRKVLWHGTVKRFPRAEGSAALLRRVAQEMESDPSYRRMP